MPHDEEREYYGALTEFLADLELEVHHDPNVKMEWVEPLLGRAHRYIYQRRDIAEIEKIIEDIFRIWGNWQRGS